MAISKIKLDGNSVNGSDTRIWVDGEEITDKVRAVNVRLGVDEINQAEITLAAPEVEIAGLADVTYEFSTPLNEPVEVMSPTGLRTFVPAADGEKRKLEEPVRPDTDLPKAPHRKPDEKPEPRKVNHFLPGPVEVYVDDEPMGTANWVLTRRQDTSVLSTKIMWVEFSIDGGGHHRIEQPSVFALEEERDEYTGQLLGRLVKVWTRP